MYPVSDRFLAALSRSHTVVTKVHLFRTDGRVEQLDHVTGSVQVDRGAAVRRTCTITIHDTGLIPRTPTDKLSVYGATLRVERGILFADGTEEVVPLGVFRLDDVDGDPDEGPVSLQGKGLEAVIADDKFTAPTRVTGTAVGAIETLITASIPDAVIINEAVDAAIGPKTYDTQGDRWDAVRECARAIGAEVYADADGQFVIAELPDIATANVAWEIAAGEGGAYVKARRGMSSAGVHNGVLAMGENTETDAPPVSALIVDTDSTSPTWWDGPFGHRPDFYSSNTLTNVSQCTAAATLLLRSKQAPNAIADITSLPNPALEPGDVLRVIYPDGSRELHQAHQFPVPLEPGGDFQISTISAKEDG